MKTLGMVAVAMTAALMACGDGGGGGGGSLSQRCDSTCAKRNKDPECEPGNDINCAATCASLTATANATGCNTQYDALLTCFETTSDLCPSPNQLGCMAENTALVVCENSHAGDAGP